MQDPLLQGWVIGQTGQAGGRSGSWAHTHLSDQMPGALDQSALPAPDGTKDLTRKGQALLSFLGV